MLLICCIFLSVIFFLIALLHFYWATGGQWGRYNSVPVTKEGKQILNTGTISCIVVGTGLLLFSAFYALQLRDAELIPAPLVNVVGWIIPSVFLLRAIGDFNYVGFFKKVKHSGFARLDTAYFSPLCLLIANVEFVVKLLS